MVQPTEVRKTKEKQGEEGGESGVVSWTFKTKCISDFKSHVKQAVGSSGLWLDQEIGSHRHGTHLNWPLLPPAFALSPFFPFIFIITLTFLLLLPSPLLLCPFFCHIYILLGSTVLLFFSLHFFHHGIISSLEICVRSHWKTPTLLC